MKIGIVGSRTFQNYSLLEKTIRENVDIESIDEVISGGAVGADRLGERFATIHKIKKTVFYPEWNKYGKIAGNLRNIKIVRSSDLVFAFWDGESKGTKHSIDLCRQHDKQVIIQRFKGEYMNKVVLIDGNNIAHICFHSAQNVLKKQGEVDNREAFLEGMTYHLFFNKLISFVKQFQGHYFITWDSKNSIAWRQKTFAEYKSDRAEKQNSDTPILFRAMDRLREVLPSLPVYQYMEGGFEADDIIFQCSSEAYESGSEIIVISNDSDLLQIVQRFPNVKQFDPKKNVFMKAPTDYNIAVFKALAGDPTDHIPGVKGIGKVTAEKLAKEVYGMKDTARFKTISKFLKDDVEKIKQFKTFFDIVNIENNPSLVVIDIDTKFLYSKKEFDVDKFKTFLEEHKLNSHMNNLDKTVKLFNSLYEIA